MIPNLYQEIQFECSRVREAVARYDEIGAAGVFGARMLRAAIKEGEDAVVSSDFARMIAALQSLRGCAE